MGTRFLSVIDVPDNAVFCPRITQRPLMFGEADFHPVSGCYQDTRRRNGAKTAMRCDLVIGNVNCIKAEWFYVIAESLDPTFGNEVLDTRRQAVAKVNPPLSHCCE